MKILQVIPSMAAASGGPASTVQILSRALARKGHEVTIYTTDTDEGGRVKNAHEEPLSKENITTVFFAGKRVCKYALSLSLARALHKNVLKYDIVHAYSLFQFSTLAVSHYCRMYKKPFVIEPIGQLDPLLMKKNYLIKRLYFEIFERGNLGNAAMIRVTSQAEKLWLESLGIFSKVTVIPLGIDIGDFQGVERGRFFCSRYPILRGKKVILFLGRITPKKGLDILVNAFVRIARTRHDVYLVIAGPDHEGYGTQIKKWLGEEGVSDKVIFSGMLLRGDKAGALRDSDLFVLPSYSENFGMAVIEAMASDTPVIISNKVGISRLIEERQAGMVAACDPEDFYEKIAYLLNDDGMAKRLATNAKKLVADEYSIDLIAEKVHGAYSRILSKSAG